MNKKYNQQGYIALITVVLITAIVVTIGLTTSLLSVNDLLSSYAGRKNEEVIDIVEGCVEDALLRLNKNNNIPSTISLPEGSCTITINSQTGTNWDFTVISPSTYDYTKRMRVVVNRVTNVTVTSWVEQ